MKAAGIQISIQKNLQQGTKKKKKNDDGPYLNSRPWHYQHHALPTKLTEQTRLPNGYKTTQFWHYFFLKFFIT